MQLGNDIIDLSEARRHRPQYFERLRRLSCHENEWQQVGFLPPPDDLWLLWSIKESAFKSIVKSGRDIRFNGKHFPVRGLQRQDQGCVSEVTIDEQVIPVRSVVNAQYIYSHVSSAKEGVQMEIVTFPDADYQTQSQRLKREAIGRLSTLLNIPNESITIVKDSLEVPVFQKDGEKMKVDLTLSHHGRFGAYVFSL